MHTLLLTNDDGIDAPGLEALVTIASEFGEPWVVAPVLEQSGRGHAVTLREPLRVREIRPRWLAVSGTPADCVILGLHALLPRRPALVVSGINAGANLGDDLLYSGTVAAALEARVHGVPGVAFSIAGRPAPGSPVHWDTAAHVARGVLADVLARGLPEGVALNVNVPNRPYHEVLGTRVCPLGRRRFTIRVDAGTDPSGGPYYWLGARHDGFYDYPGSDGVLLTRGYTTVSPVGLDRTDASSLEALRHWPSLSANAASPLPEPVWNCTLP